MDHGHCFFRICPLYFHGRMIDMLANQQSERNKVLLITVSRSTLAYKLVNISLLSLGSLGWYSYYYFALHSL